MRDMDRRVILESMMQIHREAGVTISRILDGVVPEKYMGLAQLGPSARECAKSPVGLCVYKPMAHDAYNNRAMDGCIFCDCPEEEE